MTTAAVLKRRLVYTIIIDTTTCTGERNVSKKKIRNVRSLRSSRVPVRRWSVRPILSCIEIASKFLLSLSAMSATGWDRSPTRSILTRAHVTLLYEYYMISALAITRIVLCYYLCSYYLFVVVILWLLLLLLFFIIIVIAAGVVDLIVISYGYNCVHTTPDSVHNRKYNDIARIYVWLFDRPNKGLRQWLAHEFFKGEVPILVN